jgi:hypothetical protein
MAEPSTQIVPSLLTYLDAVSPIGLAFIVWALMTGRLVTKREHEREVLRCEKLDQRLERALHIGDRAMDASDKLAERLPAKN